MECAAFYGDYLGTEKTAKKKGSRPPVAPLPARDENDTKHMCPLQLDVIERCIHLWTNPGDLVFSPFTGIGSEGYCAIKMGRKFVGSELKPQYWDLACKNIEEAKQQQKGLF